MTEIGILQTKSEADNSLYMALGGEHHETRIKDGRLFVRPRAAMMGYLNAESPFDGDGWLDTNDVVLTRGDVHRIVGRDSDVINVGGEKVFPIEVENVLEQMPDIEQATVLGENHLLLGQTVVANLKLRQPTSGLEMKKRIREFCRGRLQPFMIPTKVRIVKQMSINERFKKTRSAQNRV